MKRSQVIGIATIIAIGFCLFGIISNSQAAEITSMSADNGAPGFYMSLTTDENIWVINWFVKQMHPHTEADDDYECVHTSGHPDGPRSVYVNIGYLEEHIKIANYYIKAEVIFANANHDPDTATTSVAVRKTIDDTGYKETGLMDPQGSLHTTSMVPLSSWMSMLVYITALMWPEVCA